MTISQDQLQKVSQKLSKIKSENPKLFGNINDIIHYVDTLQEVDTTGVIPTMSVVENICPLREDSIQNPLSVQPQELLSATSQKVVADQIVLPNIME